VQCQLALTGARVIDPESGLDAIRTVGVSDGTIVAITTGEVLADQVVDITGQVLSPGFIDLHSHAQSLTGMRLQALDGVTTALDLEAGALPVRERYRRSMEEGRPINFGFSASWALARLHLFDGVPLGAADGILAGHQAKPGWRARVGPADRARLLDLIEANLADGAVGIGVLLGYAPETSRDEYFQVASLASRLGVPVFTHARYIGGGDEPHTSLEGAVEVIAAATGTGAQMHLCHVNSTSDRMIDEVAEAVLRARGYGVRVSTEAYPYGAASTVIGAPFFTPERFARVGIRPQALTYLPTGERVASLDRLAELRERDPGGAVIFDWLDERDDADRAMLLRSLLLAETAIASDAMPLLLSGASADNTWPVPPEARVHPRSLGTYARTFRWLVRELGVLSLGEAVRRCSLLPAQILGESVPAMRRKGRVQVGADADFVVFDPAAIADQATYTSVVPSTGIAHVLVGGVFVVRDGALVPSANPGRPILSG
jgi:cytosine/adenosine deaminase-related metal-dependent hydrolase